MTTFRALLTPLQLSSIDRPDLQQDSYHAYVKAYTIITMLSTCFSLMAIFMSTFYNLLFALLLTTNEDLLWFIVHIPSVDICFGLMIAGKVLLYRAHVLAPQNICLSIFYLSLYYI